MTGWSKAKPPGELGSALTLGLGYGRCAGMALFLVSGAALTMCQRGAGGGWVSAPLSTSQTGLQNPGIPGSLAVAAVFSAPTAPFMSSLMLRQTQGRESESSICKQMEHQSSGQGQPLWRRLNRRGNANYHHRQVIPGVLAGKVAGSELVEWVGGGLGCVLGGGSSLCSSSSRGCRRRTGQHLGLGGRGLLGGDKCALRVGICELGTVWFGSGLGLGCFGIGGVAVGTVLNSQVGNGFCLARGLLLSLTGSLGDSGDGVNKKIRKTVVGGGGKGGNGSVPEHRNSSPNKPDLLQRRRWTNILLGVNIAAFVIQVASKGRLLLWGAKVNSLIEAGQFWRLITPAILHANVGHLMVNCYSLNSVGPVVEELGGPRRFLAVYALSAFAGTLASYRMCTSPSVGASGAIFGLVGALAVFFARHRRLLGNSGNQNLQSLSRVIALNMLLGVASSGVDNWGHVGGLLGGAATAWVLGPALVFQTPPGGGKRQLVDRPPYTLLFRSDTSLP